METAAFCKLDALHYSVCQYLTAIFLVLVIKGLILFQKNAKLREMIEDESLMVVRVKLIHTVALGVGIVVWIGRYVLPVGCLSRQKNCQG